MRKEGDEKEMKKMRDFTMRGRILDDADGPVRLHLFDGKFNTGYIVKRFVIAPNEPNNSGLDCAAVLSTVPKDRVDASGNLQWNWDDPTEVAWASTFAGGGGTVETVFNLTDPDNLIVDDLFIQAELNAAGGSSKIINYFIELEQYDIDDWMGTIALARDQASGA